MAYLHHIVIILIYTDKGFCIQLISSHMVTKPQRHILLVQRNVNVYKEVIIQMWPKYKMCIDHSSMCTCANVMVHCSHHISPCPGVQSPSHSTL